MVSFWHFSYLLAGQKKKVKKHFFCMCAHLWITVCPQSRKSGSTLSLMLFFILFGKNTTRNHTHLTPVYTHVSAKHEVSDKYLLQYYKILTFSIWNPANRKRHSQTFSSYVVKQLEHVSKKHTLFMKNNSCRYTWKAANIHKQLLFGDREKLPLNRC